MFLRPVKFRHNNKHFIYFKLHNLGGSLIISVIIELTVDSRDAVMNNTDTGLASMEFTGKTNIKQLIT